MNDFGTGLIIGIFIGSFIGVAIMALLAMARDPEPPKQGKHEPAKLWAKGNLCRWKGDTYVIYAMETDERNQTVAVLGNGHDAVFAPIEELEEENDEEHMARDPEPKKREPEQKEPTIMWTVGNLCKFEGDIYEIKSFMEINGHTHVRLSHYDTGSSLSVPIEELEEVE